MNVIDLFSGVGGFSTGFEKAGFKIVAANEIDPIISESYMKNHPDTIMYNCNISDFIKELRIYKNNVDIIIGGPPCQGFSMAGSRIRNKKSFLIDERNYLFRYYFEVVQFIEPKYFVMENVPGMLSMEKGLIIDEIEKIFSDESNFKKGKYYLYKTILNAADYGVPQERKRLVIIGSKRKIDFDLLIKQTKDELMKEEVQLNVSIYDAISDLNYLSSGEGRFEQKYKTTPLTYYQKARRKNSENLYNHIATNHNNVALSRIKQLLPGEKRGDLKDSDRIKSIHSGAYGRMRWEDKSKTLITRFDTPSSGVYIHPEQNRTITPREAARLQSFDDDFVFYGNKSSIIKQIGNAVPPILANFIAKVLINAEREDSNG